MKSRTILAHALRREGFVRDGADRDPLLYVARIDGRQVDVQLWSDGKHRASNALRVEGDDNCWRWSTPPTPFETLDEMRAALEHEWKRMDHPPAPGVEYR